MTKKPSGYGRKLVPIGFLLCIGCAATTAMAQDHEALQARDLDAEPGTIEAYYYSPQNVTWLADANLGKSNTFGLSRAPITDYGLEINTAGEMLRGALPAYLAAMNDSYYLGYNSWRLPVAQAGGDTDCSVQIDDGALTWGSGCTGPEVGAFNAMLVSTYGSIDDSPFVIPAASRHWLQSSGPAGRHYYEFGGEGELAFCGAGRCQPALVWPVHDGDIGVAITTAECIDSDGDGWGWNGTASCFLQPVVTACIDTEPLNDGWGWNGFESCETEQTPMAGECVDYEPVGDGWGWNGVASCVITVADDIVNIATGAAVDFTKLAWTTQDVTGGSLLCEAFTWSDAASDYVPVSPGQRTRYDHVVGDDDYSGRGTRQILRDDGAGATEGFDWWIEDGAYNGSAPIGGSNSVVSTIEDTIRGFNVWTDSFNYQHCTGIHSADEALEPCLYAASDTDGDGYGWEDATSCLITPESAPARALYHAVTGELINLVPLNWRTEDFVETVIGCTAHHFDGTGYVAGNLLTWYVHDVGEVTESWVASPDDMRGLRLLPGESVILLDFDAVKTYTEDRTVVHFNIEQLPDSVPPVTLVVPIGNIDEGAPAGTFEVFFFAGDGVVSTDEWDAGILHTSFYEVWDQPELKTDVTDILQQAKDNGDTYLSFKFTGGTGTDRYWLDEDNATLQSGSYNAGSFWIDSGVYHGAAPIDAYSELVWLPNHSNGFRSWIDINTYSECLGTQPAAYR